MYDIFLPKMSKIFQEAAFNDKLMAEAIVVGRERTIMILEDLAPLRYTNADRVKQLDMAHTKLVLDMMAKFHSAAIILNQREPKLFSRNYSSHFFSRGKNVCWLLRPSRIWRVAMRTSSTILSLI